MSLSNDVLKNDNDSLYRQLKDIEKANDEFKLERKVAKLTITQYCDNLRNDVDMMTQSAVDHLNDISKTLHKQINEYEKELIGSFEMKTKQNEKANENWDKLINECEKFNERMKMFLAKNGEDEQKLLLKVDNKQELEKMLKVAKKLKEDLDKETASFRRLLFKEKSLKFIDNEGFFESDQLLGYLKQFDSGINFVEKKYIKIKNI